MATRHLGDALERLAAIDLRLDQEAPARLTLCPERAFATPLRGLGEALLSDATQPGVAAAFVDGLERLALAFHANFPENIFWDMDYMAAALMAQGEPEAMEEVTGLAVTLQEGFGQHSIICFRYIHDFIYGFDWTRWVAREPEARRDVGPFDLTFLRYLHRRRAELVELIAVDDAKYGKIPEGQPRNPFGFSREPADERRLHEVLASRGLVPVQAWRLDGRRSWERPFTQLRETVAEEIGVPGRG